MQKYSLTIAIALLFSLVYAKAMPYQSAPKARVYGKVNDAKTGEPLFGVVVAVEGTGVGVTTDFEGQYNLTGLANGTYKVKFKLLSYKEKVVEVAVNSNEPQFLSVSLEDASTDLGIVEVVGNYKQESVNSLLIDQKKAVAISDGISAEAIKRTPDNNTSEVMKRISGASIQDNRFAIIRGLNDRYNIAFLNGAPLPSTESDRRAFAFDIFPANMLDKLVVTKAATPDLPADFAGGVINVITRDIPEENFVSIGGSAGYNSITTFNERAYYQGGKTDWLGFDDGTRGLPGSIPDAQTYKTATTAGDSSKLFWSKDFGNNWATKRKQSTAPNGSFQFSLGTKVDGEKNQLGLVFATSYTNSFRFSNVTRNQYDVLDNNSLLRTYNDSLHKREVLGGMLFNIAYKIGDNNKIALKNIYSINTEDQSILRSGLTNVNDTFAVQQVRNTAYWYQQNQLLANQLVGEHFAPKGLVRVKWTAGYSHAQRDMPDFRRVSYARAYDLLNPENNTGKYTAQIGNQVQLEQAGRFFSTLAEDQYSGSYEVSLPLKFIETKNLETNFKAGGFNQYRSRVFSARSFGYVFKTGGGLTNAYKQGALDTIFSPDNFKYNRFYIDDATNPTDAYTANSTLHAGFVMLDQRIAKKIRLVYGVRLENFTQKLFSKDSNGEDLNVNTNRNDWLPSLNFTYEVTNKANLRFSASKTLSRPEFREIAPFAFYDFNLDAVVAGKPTLERATIGNFDVRYEYYPTGGELISASAFYKTFKNPIEFINEPNVGAGSRRFGYANAPSAQNYGFEFEVRKNFAFIDSLTGGKLFGNLLFFGNFAYIVSTVDLSAFGEAGTGTRPLQGQSPYIVNTGLQFNEPKTNLGFSVLFNRVGRRIAYVGNVQVPDIYENPRTVIDFQINKKFYKMLDVKFTLGDVLAQNLTFYQDMNNNKKLDRNGADNIIFDYSYGLNMSLGLNLKF